MEFDEAVALADDDEAVGAKRVIDVAAGPGAGGGRESHAFSLSMIADRDREEARAI
jgi:hypothetical protein